MQQQSSERREHNKRQWYRWRVSLTEPAVHSSTPSCGRVDTKIFLIESAATVAQQPTLNASATAQAEFRFHISAKLNT